MVYKNEAKTILCYGDSNTWGYVPCNDYSLPKARYLRNERWPGIMQKILGDYYYIVEEGLNSRTTNLDYKIPPERNGKIYLPPCLYSHAPIDLVLLALGANDTKIYFNRTAHQIKEGLSELIEIIQTSSYGFNLQVPPEILIISSVIPLKFTENFVDEKGICFLSGAIKKAEMLAILYSELASEKGCFYLDVTKISPSEIDGMHYDKAGHQLCAEMISRKIKSIFEAKKVK